MQAKDFAAFTADKLPRMVRGIAAMHKPGAKHLLGDALTIADIMLLYMSDAATAFGAGDLTAAVPTLKPLVEAVRSSPMLVAYFAALPEVHRRDAEINAAAKAGGEASGSGGSSSSASTAGDTPDAKRARREGEGDGATA